MTVSYKNLNSLKLAEPLHHTRPRLNVFLVEDIDGYPQISTTNQRRRREAFKNAHLHRGFGNDTSKEIRRKVTDAEGRTTWQPVGIWRGIDKRCRSSVHYTGERLRMIRATHGVGRPVISIVRVA